MTVEQMREWLYSAYPNSTWRNKVDKMYGNYIATGNCQIIAVYKKFEREGRFEKKKREPHTVQMKMDI